jgi:hypothetical protein
MSIECYYSSCKYHSCHYGGEGPFCDEDECKSTKEDLQQFEKQREDYLNTRPNNSAPS